MSSSPRVPLLLALLVVLVATLYPALLLKRPLAPEISLRHSGQGLWEPAIQPSASPLALHAATRLGPRLAGMSREGLGLALWNPLIAGGRPGWLASPEEGGAPLPLVVALLAREGWHWTALVALHIGFALAGAALVLGRLGASPWAAAAGGVAYALSGASVATWLSWQGSVAALGPWVLLPSLTQSARFRTQALCWSASCLLVLLCGPPAYAFLLLALGIMMLGHDVRDPRRWLALAVGAALALALRAPALWLDRWGWEQPKARWPGEEGPLLGGLRALVDPFAGGDPTELPLEDLLRPTPDPGLGFLGVIVIVLAVAGLTNRTFRLRRLWGAVAGVSLILLLLPEAAWLGIPGIPRPAGALALAAAVLSGAAVHRVLQGLAEPRHGLVGALICTLILLHLLPPAARRLPFATPDSVQLDWPISSAGRPDSGGLTGLLSTLPPDVAASFGIPDVRAADLSREPRYASLLGLRDDGAHPLLRALDPTAPRLGTEVILEPGSLRLVSQQVYSRLEIVEAACDPRRTPTGHGFCAVPIPAGVFRAGVAATDGAEAELFVRRGDGLLLAGDDRALEPESGLWKWTVLPEDCCPECCSLELRGTGLPALVNVAWDRSWLELVGEEAGTRVWRRRDLPPPVYAPSHLVAELDPLPGPLGSAAVPLGIRQQLPGNGSVPVEVKILERSNHRWVAEVSTDSPAVLVARIKYRPRLWRVRIDGTRAPTFPADMVWTGTVIPAGVHRITWQVELPVWIWALAGTGLVALVSLTGWRRQ